MNDAPDREIVEIESLLRRTATAFTYPPTPSLAPAVRARIAPAAAPRGRPGGWLRPGLVAAALVPVIVAIAAALSVPASRSAIADFFHLSHVRIDRAPEGSPTPLPLSPDSFARPSSVEELRGAVDFPLRLPSNREGTIQPDAVYLQGEEYHMPTAIFVYGSYDLYETRYGLIQKLIGGSAPVSEIAFDGHGAYWVAAGGHIVQSLDAEGRLVIGTERAVDRATLAWEEEGITYRIESSLSQAETVAVAKSLR